MSRKTRRRAAQQFRRSDRNLKAQHRRRGCHLQHDAHVRAWHIAVATLWCCDPEDWTPEESELVSRPVPAEHRKIIAWLC